MYPLIAYPHSRIDPCVDDTRDEGEDRLKLLRPLLRSAASILSPGFCSFEDQASFASLLGPKTLPYEPEARAGVMQARESVQNSLLKANHACKPAIVRLQNTVKLLKSQQADKLNALERSACIPVAWSEYVAQPSSKGYGPVSVLVTWPRKTFPGSSKHRPRLVIMEAKNGVIVEIYSCEGEKHTIEFKDAPTPIVLRLMASNETNAEPSPPQPLQAPPVGILPERLALNIAAFFQNRMRSEVLISAAAPDGRSRPVAFNHVKLETAKKGLEPALCVTATFHPSSCKCLCKAHNLDPINVRFPSCRFDGQSRVTLTMRMCGLSCGSEDGQCIIHKERTVKNRFAPGICCARCDATFTCWHDGARGDEKTGIVGIKLHVPIVEEAWRELTMILGAAARYGRRSQAAGNDAARRTQEMNTVINELDAQIHAFEQQALTAESRVAATTKKMISKASTAQNDATALRMLCEGGIVQVQKPRNSTSTQHRLQRYDQTELDKAEKQVQATYYWLFPAPGKPFQTREQFLRNAEARAAQKPRARKRLVEEAQTSSSESLSKQPTLQDPRYAYNTMIEYIDVRGVAECRRQINALMNDDKLVKAEVERADMFVRWLDALERECGDEVDGPLGYPALPLECTYRERHGGGRIYCTGMAQIDDAKGKAKSVCIQGAPREMRPFVCCRWAHDYDLKNCQPLILFQLPNKLTWAEREKPLEMEEMGRWCHDRSEWIEHVAEFHSLPSDAERFEDYRKDTVKELMIRLMFGGTYKGWLLDQGFSVKYEPRSPRVEALAKELEELREAVFSSHEWVQFTINDRERLRKEGKKLEEDIDKSVFARIAQTLENQVLTSMRGFLRERGWQALSLCFDGLIVQHRPERVLDLEAMNARIKEDTGFDLEVVEKPLYSPNLPLLSLARAK